MLLLEKDETMTWTGPAADGAGRTRATIELPEALLDQQANLIDRVLTFAFDVLDLQAVELRIRSTSAEGGTPKVLMQLPCNSVKWLP
jgi:hypothetical protein